MGKMGERFVKVIRGCAGEDGILTVKFERLAELLEDVVRDPAEQEARLSAMLSEMSSAEIVGFADCERMARKPGSGWGYLTREIDRLRAKTALQELKVRRHTERRFPVHTPRLGCPSWVPWDFLAPHEAWAWKNHEQTLEKLASRGGLCASEMVAVVEGRRWRSMDDAEANRRLAELIEAWEIARARVAALGLGERR
jgi:hypothetical protein